VSTARVKARGVAARNHLSRAVCVQNCRFRRPGPAYPRRTQTVVLAQYLSNDELIANCRRIRPSSQRVTVENFVAVRERSRRSTIVGGPRRLFAWPSKHPRHFSCFRLPVVMKVRLIRKLADQLDGVNVSQKRVGDVLELRPEEARALIAEGWATADERRRSFASPPFGDRRRVRSAALADNADEEMERAS
jgi:hypothetical protein